MEVLSEGHKKMKAQEEAKALHLRHTQMSGRLLRAEKRAHDAEAFLLSTWSSVVKGGPVACRTQVPHL